MQPTDPDSSTQAGHKKGTALFLVGLAVLLCLALVALSCAVLDHVLFSPAHATREVQVDLTYLHGEEVWAAIENFEARWGSSETLENPDLYEEIAAEPLLPYIWQQLDMNANWGGYSFPDVAGIRVLEYTPEQFRAIACLNNPSPGGLYNPGIYLIQYIFEHHNGLWKAAAILNMNDGDDVRRIMWSDGYGPNWLRDYFREWTHYSIDSCIDIRQPAD